MVICSMTSDETIDLDILMSRERERERERETDRQTDRHGKSMGIRTLPNFALVLN